MLVMTRMELPLRERERERERERSRYVLRVYTHAKSKFLYTSL